jgi:hypothetical protein
MVAMVEMVDGMDMVNVMDMVDIVVFVDMGPVGPFIRYKWLTFRSWTWKAMRMRWNM